MKKFLCLCACLGFLACHSSSPLETRQEAARDACWKSLVNKISSDLHAVKWTTEQGLPSALTTSDSVFSTLVEESMPQWNLKGNRAVINTVYGGWQRIEYVCHYNPIATEVVSMCYSDHPGECE